MKSQILFSSENIISLLYAKRVVVKGFVEERTVELDFLLSFQHLNLVMQNQLTDF